jgi:hypothetical protein
MHAPASRPPNAISGSNVDFSHSSVGSEKGHCVLLLAELLLFAHCASSSPPTSTTAGSCIAPNNKKVWCTNYE